MTVGQWLDFAVELRLDGVECAPPMLQPLGPVTAAEYRRLAEARGLAVSNYTAYSEFVHPDPVERRRLLEAALQNVSVTRELGAPSVRALTGQRWPGIPEPEALQWVVEGISRVAEAADGEGLRVNVENHTKASTWKDFDFAMQSDVFLKVMEGLKGAPVGVQFDTANPIVAGEDVLDLFVKVRDRIGYVHANDARTRGVFEFCVLGTGLAPIPEVLAGLRGQGYDGWIGIEEASRTGREGFRRSVEFMRRALAAL
jgi:sugar phosphate isomerase/epimerase